MKLAKPGIREFEKVAAMGWGDGVSLDELLSRVNRVASKMLPGLPTTTDSRINPTLVPRTFRHYVTLGCIQPGRREGRRAVYDYRHFLQTMLVRRLLWERVPADRIASLIARKNTWEMERLFLGGVRFVAGSEVEPTANLANCNRLSEDARSEIWSRTLVAPGVELHLQNDVPMLRGTRLRSLLLRLGVVLRSEIRSI